MLVSRRALFGLPAALAAAAAFGAKRAIAFPDTNSAPAAVTAFTENGPLPLTRDGARWTSNDVVVNLGANGAVSIRAPQSALVRIRLRWQGQPTEGLHYLGDHWERSYGDLAWRALEPERILPWYFLATDGNSTVAYGVRTGANAIAFWQADSSGLTLWLDVRNGGRGVQLRDRELLAAHLVSASYSDNSPFAAACRFCKLMSPSPRLPAAPVYGGNNWYYAYGKSSAGEIRADSERIAALSPSGTNRPFMVIDDGWQPERTAGPWTEGNAKFPDMAALARDMRKIGVRPGIWVRPLYTTASVSESWQLNSPQAKRESARRKAWTLDPTVPEVAELIARDMKTVAGWGYELIKHDFSTYDLYGRWGFAMGADLTDAGWHFADRSKTTAEIVLDLYRNLRRPAGDALLIGCNTIGHLGAGIFELQRTGDDTSGRDWNRTRKMGINTLAFRAPQHNAFFAVDADCVGLTKQVPWQLNRLWLDLLARSGTPLFVSAAPDALGPEQRSALKAAFAAASQPQSLCEPLDWLQSTEPAHWRLNGKQTSYDWFSPEGASPFST